MDFAFLNEITPLYTQTEFWIRLIAMVLVWYALALGFAHLLFGAGREAITSAKGGMWMAFGVVMITLFSAGYFWWSARELLYTVTITVTFMLVTLFILAVLSRLGSRE